MANCGKLIMNYILKTYSFRELIEIFPEAKPYVKQKLKREIAQWEKDLVTGNKMLITYRQIIRKTIPKNQWFLEMMTNILYIEPYIKPQNEELEKKIKKNFFILSLLRTPDPEKLSVGKITEQDIMRAKEEPIINYIEVNRMGFAHCPFHEDKHASLKVYKSNRWWCYSENVGGDVIDLVMKMRGVKFLEAVKIILRK